MVVISFIVVDNFLGALDAIVGFTSDGATRVETDDLCDTLKRIYEASDNSKKRSKHAKG